MVRLVLRKASVTFKLGRARSASAFIPFHIYSRSRKRDGAEGTEPMQALQQL
jgi:hypothetical protein